MSLLREDGATIPGLFNAKSLPYLPQVHCRHTWITAAVDHPNLNIKDVAYLARGSPKVLYDHYAGRTRKPLVPEF